MTRSGVQFSLAAPAFLMILFSDIDPFETGQLGVSDGHKLHWERCGKRGGVPIVFLHGGPGSGSVPAHRRFFDPELFDVLLFDQRGTGRSTPKLSLVANDLDHQISDIEALRSIMGVDRWIVMGPSWGSTLALAYAQAHPDRVSGLLVEGVFLGTDTEIDWWHALDGAPRFFPDAFEPFVRAAPEAVRSSAAALRNWYLETMQEEWAAGAPELQRLSDPSASFETLRRSALYRWTEYEDQLSWLAGSADITRKSLAERGPDYVATHSLIEAHYFANRCFLEEGQLLADTDRLRNIPMQIIQSRYDMVCPPCAAFDLAAACPHAEMALIPVNGHAMTDAVYPAVLSALNKLA